MSRAFHVFLILLFLSIASVTAGWLLPFGLTPESRHPQLRRFLLQWTAKGLLLPILIWALMNIGLSWNLQPFMPQVQAARNNGINWLAAYLRVMANGIFIISSYWSAVTLAWTLAETARGTDGEARKQLKAMCLTCFVATILPALATAYFGGWPLVGLAGVFLLAPMAGYGASVLQVKKQPPMYARAVARMKFGKYSEAEWEIIHELEQHEDDFDGWMMLADLYANHFNDLLEAEQTILEICDQPRTTPSQLSVALHRLADWHLNRASDPDAARRSLQVICDRLPGTHLARMAQLRMNQLPVSVAELHQQKTVSTIPLPALSEAVDHAPPHVESPKERQKATQAANDCVEVLKADPNNVPAREKLARLFAEHLGEPDLAIEQVTLLLDMPDQPDARRAEWLSLIAAWQIRYRYDHAAGRMLLERLLREFPETPQAFAARRRLQLLDAESRSRATGQ